MLMHISSYRGKSQFAQPLIFPLLQGLSVFEKAAPCRTVAEDSMHIDTPDKIHF